LPGVQADPNPKMRTNNMRQTFSTICVFIVPSRNKIRFELNLDAEDVYMSSLRKNTYHTQTLPVMVFGKHVFNHFESTSPTPSGDQERGKIYEATAN
jgi:hypothetical protein